MASKKVAAEGAITVGFVKIAETVGNPVLYPHEAAHCIETDNLPGAHRNIGRKVNLGGGESHLHSPLSGWPVGQLMNYQWGQNVTSSTANMRRSIIFSNHAKTGPRVKAEPGKRGYMAEEPQEDERGPGRPASYDPTFARQAAKLSELGATDQELADFFEVDVRTIYRWKHDHDEFCQALKVGKEIADERVERSLYQRAIGYEQEEVKIFMPANADKPVYAPYRAKIPASDTAAIFWLKNRRKDDWRDKREVEHSGNLSLGAALDTLDDDDT